MLVSVIAVGKPGFLAGPIWEYERRLGRYWRFEVGVVPAGRGTASHEVLRRESAALRNRLRPDYRRIALTRKGEQWSSLELARWMERQAVGSARGVHFVVGGAFGLDPELRRACCHRLSLSPMTLPHDLARLMLAEQLYRAGTILRNEPYHKGPK